MGHPIRLEPLGLEHVEALSAAFQPILEDIILPQTDDIYESIVALKQF